MSQHRKRAAAIFVVAALVFAAPADAAPTSQLCDDGSYRSRHPLICDTGGPLPGIGSGGGGADGGGLLGIIGRALHGLTGGLL